MNAFRSISCVCDVDVGKDLCVSSDKTETCHTTLFVDMHLRCHWSVHAAPALIFGRCLSSRSPACPGCRRPTRRIERVGAVADSFCSRKTNMLMADSSRHRTQTYPLEGWSLWFREPEKRCSLGPRDRCSMLPITLKRVQGLTSALCRHRL